MIRVLLCRQCDLKKSLLSLSLCEKIDFFEILNFFCNGKEVQTMLKNKLNNDWCLLSFNLQNTTIIILFYFTTDNIVTFCVLLLLIFQNGDDRVVRTTDNHYIFGAG